MNSYVNRLLLTLHIVVAKVNWFDFNFCSIWIVIRSDILSDFLAQIIVMNPVTILNSASFKTNENEIIGTSVLHDRMDDILDFALLIEQANIN